ncbi:MAG TPA: methyltransferase domain-containing protein [Saprospiraceae bacterium]|nr:methyltransferase domain-containing protein [Saprospiraceae bacterium]
MKDTPSETWYEDFFKGINCELWENAVSPEWTRQEVDFLLTELNLQPGQRILDIPCGFGRHSVEFAKRGFHVTGVDISETFIHKLQEKIYADKLTIHAVQTDILAMELNETFDGAVCMGNSFGYFSYEKMEIFVDKVSECLQRGARFIINSGMIAESILPNFSKNRSFTIGDIQMDIMNEYNTAESFMTSHIFYTKGEVKEEHAFRHYVFTLGEIKWLLKMFGLRLKAAYNSPAKVEFSIGDHQVYIVAEKE